jgi:hypothetical protein
MTLSSRRPKMKTKPEKKQLSEADLHRMLASGAKLATENAQVQVENLKAVVNQQAAELVLLKAQLTMIEASRQDGERQKQAMVARTTAKAEHELLSQSLAKTYGVDWKKAAFCPYTGTIEPLDAAGTLGDDA